MSGILAHTKPQPTSTFTGSRSASPPNIRLLIPRCPLKLRHYPWTCITPWSLKFVKILLLIMMMPHVGFGVWNNLNQEWSSHARQHPQDPDAEPKSVFWTSGKYLLATDAFCCLRSFLCSSLRCCSHRKWIFYCHLRQFGRRFHRAACSAKGRNHPSSFCGRPIATVSAACCSAGPAICMCKMHQMDRHSETNPSVAINV